MQSCVRVLGLGLLLVLLACAAFGATIPEAKALANDEKVTLSAKVVTYVGTGFFYIEEDSRSMGIRVEKATYDLDIGTRADVSGYMKTNDTNKERYIEAYSADPTDPPADYTIEPVGINNKALGGGDWSLVGTGGQQGISNARGLNNIGLLVRTYGQFQQIGSTTFTIDDGSGLSILCSVPDGRFLSSTWQSVIVTGISSMREQSGLYMPLLLVTDIEVILPEETISTPGTPTGETTPLVGLSYSYKTTGATCSQGHPIEYSFNWGDGSSSLWSASTDASHTWVTAGAKAVTVTARCQRNSSLSTTSAALEVIPVTQLTSSPWQMFRHDRTHSGVSPFRDPTLSGAAWSLSIGNGLSSPAIAPDGTIYLAGTNSLKAVNIDGTLKWSRSINSSTRCSPAIAVDGTVFIGGNGLFYAVSPAGAQKWTFTVNGDVSSSPTIGPDGTVYIGTRNGSLYAITPGSSSGTQKWVRSGIGAMHMTSPVVSSNGTNLYIDAGNYLYALYASNGSTKWSYNFGTSTTSSAALSPDGSTIYTGSGDGNLWSFNAATGAANWQKPVGFKPAVTSASPAIGSDGTIYLGSNYGSLYAINPDGSEKWIFEAKWDIRSSVAVNADGTVVLASHDGYVRGLDSATGREKWHHLLPDNNYASPAVMPNGTIVTATMTGVVYGNIGGTPPTTTPPSNLSIAMASATQAILTWQDNSPDEYGFRIERKMGMTGTYKPLPNVVDPATKQPTVGAEVTTYADSGLLSGQTYYYRVCAFQSGGNTAYTNEASAVTPGVQAPDALAATPISAAQVDLSWTDMSSDELGFIIERSVGPNGLYEEIAQVGPNVTAYADMTTYPARYYYYRVRGFDGTNDSSYSNWSCALTPGRAFTEIGRGNQSRNQIALTFDAGTAAIQTSLLDTLKSNNVFCNFFITGYVTEVQGSLVSRIGSDGHMSGNHTYDHPDLRFISDDEMLSQLNDTEDLVCSASGHHTRPYFRAPYGARNQHILDVAANDGFQHVYWTKDTGDSMGASTAQIIAATTAGASNGAIILCHCTAPNTAAALPTMISNLRGMGYELVTLPELVAPQQVTSPAGYLNAGWNLISLPIEPALEFPHIVFRGNSIDTKLKRWDRKTASEITYSASSPGLFGNVYADEGYWLYQSAAGTVKFNGAAATTDRRIKLQYATSPSNYGLIGYPFEDAQSFSNCSVYNPNADEPKIRSVQEAITSGWIPDRFYGWDSITQTEYDVVLSSALLEPWHGYKAAALVPGVELIIPKP